MNDGMKLYYDYTLSPLGKLFYRTVWKQLEDVKGKKVLDFGSGFAYTTNFLAENNEVTALELDADIIKAAEKQHEYTQIHGDVSWLKNVADETFDVVICHLVFEFVKTDERKIIIAELMRVLKKDGFISLIQHNRAGRVVQAVVQEYNLEDAENILNGGYSFSSAFGDIRYYSHEDLLQWTDDKMYISKVDGVRTLASLHNVDVCSLENWVDDMFKMEWQLLQHKAFVDIAYFHHLILKHR